MAFQLGFPKKLNVPQRKIQNKSMGDYQLSGRKGSMDVDNISFSNKRDVGVVGTNKVPGINGCSPDIDCKNGYK